MKENFNGYNNKELMELAYNVNEELKKRRLAAMNKFITAYTELENFGIEVYYGNDISLLDPSESFFYDEEGKLL